MLPVLELATDRFQFLPRPGEDFGVLLPGVFGLFNRLLTRLYRPIQSLTDVQVDAIAARGV